MTHSERFQKIFHFQKPDRIPCYYFGIWGETKERWLKEGLTDDPETYFPQLPGMDPDWESGCWDVHGLVRTGPIGDIETCILQDMDDRRIVRSSIGEEYLERKNGSSIPHTLVYPLKPTRESWNHFKKFLEDKPERHPADLSQKAKELESKDRVLTFVGGSLYGWLRGWMGVENVSYLMYDDPVLMEEMVCAVTDHFIELMRPVLKFAKFDFVYIFEDCCGSSGPLFSPLKYSEIFDTHYKRLLRFYKEQGVPLALIDSDGWSEDLIPSWRNSGFDIFFPIEVGKWNADPIDLRKKFGNDLRFFGAVDKNLIYGETEVLRAHLLNLKSAVAEGGFIPIPDHRIPPHVSYDQMLKYIDMFHEIFNR